MKTPLIMNQLMELPPSFYHKAPDGYSYECEEYKKNLLRIWLLHPDIFSYTTDRVRTIWGFYNPKKDQYFSPIDWENSYKDDDYYDEYKERGLKWDLYIQQYASVHDKDGKYLRDCTYDDWEVCKANGIKVEMLSDEGCEVMGWCDG